MHILCVLVVSVETVKDIQCRDHANDPGHLRADLPHSVGTQLRSFLTMFGVAWGVGSLLLLVGLGEGFRSGNKRSLAGIWGKHHVYFPGPALPQSPAA